MLVLPASCPPHCRPPPHLTQSRLRSCACLPPPCVFHPLHLTAADPPSFAAYSSLFLMCAGCRRTRRSFPPGTLILLIPPPPPPPTHPTHPHPPTHHHHHHPPAASPLPDCRLPPHPAQLPQRWPAPTLQDSVQCVGADLSRLLPFHTSELLRWKGGTRCCGNGFLVLLQHGRRGVGCCTTQRQKLGAGQTTAVAAGLCVLRLHRAAAAPAAPALCLAPTCCAAAFHQLPLLTSTRMPHSCLLFRGADPVPCEREDLQRGLRAQGQRPHQQRQGQGQPGGCWAWEARARHAVDCLHGAGGRRRTARALLACSPKPASLLPSTRVCFYRCSGVEQSFYRVAPAVAGPGGTAAGVTLALHSNGTAW